MSYVLGIDGGGSKTVCILMNGYGRVLGRGEAGASNYQTIGIEAAFKSIKCVVNAAVIEGLKLTDNIKIEAICFGLAGVGRSQDNEVVKNIFEELKISQFLPIHWAVSPSNIVICNDALIALVGGIGNDVGIVVAAGTGSIVFGRNSQGVTKRVGGWGYILGDEGSAYKIAVAGMQAALKSYDGREMSTRIIEDLQQHLGLASIEDLIEVIYRRGWGVKEIAALAPIVDNAAAQGDEVANKIINEAVEELVLATSTVVDAIFSLSEFIEVVTTGSVWQSKCKMRERFTASIVTKFPAVKVILPRYEPAYGACLLALKKLVGEKEI
jgi:N-acetylglucosamine kinase-like BadF-type ATPase